MGQDMYQFTKVPRKFKYDCWKWQLQPKAAGGTSPEEQTQQWEMKTHVPFLLRILRTGSKSDIYFGNKAWRENSAKCLQIYRRKITFVKFCFSIPFSG